MKNKRKTLFNIPITPIDRFQLMRLIDHCISTREQEVLLPLNADCSHFLLKNSNYASIDQCRKEVRRAEDMFIQNDIAYIDTSHISIEEIAGRILQKSKLERRY